MLLYLYKPEIGNNLDKEDVVYVHNGKLLSCLKNEGRHEIHKLMDRGRNKNILNELIQIQKDEYGVYLLIFGY